MAFLFNKQMCLGLVGSEAAENAPSSSWITVDPGWIRQKETEEAPWEKSVRIIYPGELELYVGRNILWDQILPWDPSIHFRMVFQMFFFLWSRFPKHNFGWEVCGVKNPWRCKSNQIGCLQRVCAVMMWKSFVATLCPQIWFTLSPVRRGGLYMWVLQSLANAAHMSNEKKLVV